MESNVGVLVKRWRMFVGVAEVIFHYSARLVSAANIQVPAEGLPAPAHPGFCFCPSLGGAH